MIVIVYHPGEGSTSTWEAKLHLQSMMNNYCSQLRVRTSNDDDDDDAYRKNIYILMYMYTHTDKYIEKKKKRDGVEDCALCQSSRASGRCRGIIEFDTSRTRNIEKGANIAHATMLLALAV